MPWLPEPPAGTHITLGFDGSSVNDWTALRARTREGRAFTPRHGDGLPTIWIPGPDGIPRAEVNAAVSQVRERFRVSRYYFDPPLWETDGDRWVEEFGETVAVPWPTYRTKQMHEALSRYFTDLSTGRFTHDGCPLTAQAAANARKLPRGARYILGKPAEHQKIDPIIADVLAHEAWADSHAAGWAVETGPTYIRLPR